MDDTNKQVVFNKILDLLKNYSPPYQLRDGSNVSGKRSAELWARGMYEVEGRKRTEIFFAGIIIQKAYIGFYFMPVYSDPVAMKKIFSQRLLKCLKGKSCFYITEYSNAIMDDIKQALGEGFRLYKQRGWI